MSFFLKKGTPKMNGKKRKLPQKDSANSNKKKKREVDDNEEILSDEFEDDENMDGEKMDIGYESDGNDDGETAEQKRIRLAKLYLAEIEREERERAKDDDQLKDLINARMKSDDLEEKGKLRREVADTLLPVEASSIRILKDKNHKLSINCVVISPDGKYLFSASKDCGIVKWKAEDGTKLFKIKGGQRGKEEKHIGHCTAINAMAISSDGIFLASGDDSKLIHIWKAETMELIKTFKGHRDSISGLAFRINTHTLFSCSYDRSVKVWNLDEMAYVETLFGHQDKITGIDAGRRERAVTSGGRDGSVRVWKIVEESQLVFNGPACSTDSVKLVNEEHFLTGGEDGHISLWGVMKKKPLSTVKAAHGSDPINEEPLWISSIASFTQTDLIASGSRDGYIRLWKIGPNCRQLEEIQKIPAKGFVNSLTFSADGKLLLAGIGQEHRLGRWWRIPEAKNSILVIPLTYK